MIFYRPLLIETVKENSVEKIFVEIDSGANFWLGQVVEICELENILSILEENTLQKSPILGQIIEINPQKIRIIVLSLDNFNKSLHSFLVKVFDSEFSFSPSLLGRFWSFFGFLEEDWQNEEMESQLLGSKLLAGKVVNYNKKPLDWQNNQIYKNKKVKNILKSISNQISVSNTNSNSNLQRNKRIAINWQEKIKNPKTYSQDSGQQNKQLKSFSEIILGQQNELKLPNFDFSENCNFIISQVKTQIPQPVFVILTQTLDNLELKNFYFQLAKSYNLFNCLVIVGDNKEQNNFLNMKAVKISQFFGEVLQKSVFLISDLKPEDLDNLVNNPQEKTKENVLTKIYL